jgi:hypothetical protein
MRRDSKQRRRGRHGSRRDRSCEGRKITAATAAAAVVGGAGGSGYFGEQHTAAAVIDESRTSGRHRRSAPPPCRRCHHRRHTARSALAECLPPLLLRLLLAVLMGRAPVVIVVGFVFAVIASPCRQCLRRLPNCHCSCSAPSLAGVRRPWRRLGSGSYTTGSSWLSAHQWKQG